jgi:protein-S-isoprenylcysteine O-methyltransferase Ste14
MEDRRAMTERESGRDTAGVIVPPPILFLGALALGAALDWLWPMPIALTLNGLGVGPVRLLLAGCFLVAGVVVLGVAVRQFRRAGTHVPTWQPTTALVTGGLYGRSRNPIYLGLIAAYLGLAILVDSPWALALLLPAVAVLRYGVVAREERYLETKFGQAYRDYMAQVRRWI